MSYRRNNTSAATAAAAVAATTTTTTTHATRRPAPKPTGQRSYIVSIDTGSFTNVEIVVGDYHHRAGVGVWRTPSSSRADTVKVVTSKSSRVYASYGPTTPPSTPTTKRTPFTPLQPQPASSAARSHTSSSTSASASVSDAWNKRTYERGDRAREMDYISPRHQTRLADERARAHIHLQRQREREEEEARRQLAEAEARRAVADAKEARRRQRLAEQHQQRHEEQKRQQRALREDRKRLERARRAREIANAWNSYETRWGLLNQNQNQRHHGGASTSLTFERIPWPVTEDSEGVIPPLDGRRTARTTRRSSVAPALDELLSPEAIREFLLSPAHSPDVPPKDRIRAALRRWHPDKFARVLGLVVESDRDAVADGMGIVVRCLNEMLERENHA